MVMNNLIAEFKNEVKLLCQKYNVCISCEGVHGGFEINDVYDNEIMNWFMEAKEINVLEERDYEKGLVETDFNYFKDVYKTYEQVYRLENFYSRNDSVSTNNHTIYLTGNGKSKIIFVDDNLKQYAFRAG